MHRYVGLAIAAFLIVAGLSGSVIAFYPQLDAALNPELLRVRPPRLGAPLLDPLTLRERVEAQLAVGKKLDAVSLRGLRDEAINFWIDGQEVFVDPYTAEILGSRTFGKLSEGRKTFLTFIYRLHYSLALDEVGTWLFGVVALLWTLDCFVGAYLTFPLPVRAGSKPRRSWLLRWAPAWLLKTRQLFSLVYTGHRAGGLWLWAMLLVFAWSAVALNLREQVYDPVMHGVLGDPGDTNESQKALAKPRMLPELSPREAYEVGRRLMALESRRRGFRVLGERWLSYEPERGSYGYTVESTLDLSERLAETHVTFDGDSGTLLRFGAPTGGHRTDTISAWLVALHFGSLRIGGLTYRIFVCTLGPSVAILSIPGVRVWLKTRRRPSARSRSHGATS